MSMIPLPRDNSWVPVPLPWCRGCMEFRVRNFTDYWCPGCDEAPRPLYVDARMPLDPRPRPIATTGGDV